MKKKDCICIFLLLILFYLITSKNNVVENMEGDDSDDKGILDGALDTAIELSGLGGLIGGDDDNDNDNDNTSSDEIEDDFVQNDDMLDIDDVYLKEDYDKVVNDDQTSSTTSPSITGSSPDSERPSWLPKMPPYIRANTNEEKDVAANILYHAAGTPEYSDYKDILKNEAKLLMTSNKSLREVGETLNNNLGEDFEFIRVKIEEELNYMKRLAPKSKSPPPPKSKALFKQKIIDSVVETCQTMGFIDPSLHGNQENTGCNGASCEKIKDEFRGMERIVDECEEMDREYRRLKQNSKNTGCNGLSCKEIENEFRIVKNECNNSKNTGCDGATCEEIEEHINTAMKNVLKSWHVGNGPLDKNATKPPSDSGLNNKGCPPGTKYQVHESKNFWRCI